MGSAKIAIKVLTQSDLSFFKVHLRLSKQKAINLNGEIFIEQFYPGLAGSSDAVYFPVTIIGPGGKPAYQLARKALRSPAAKNWRLNGEIIHDPENEPGRYDGLKAGDYGVIAFEGNARPEAMKLILVEAGSDAALHAAIKERLEFAGRHSMVVVSEEDIAELRAVTGAVYGSEHPLDTLLFGDTVEEVLFSAAESVSVGQPPRGLSVAMSPEELRRQLLAAEEVGQRGEELFGQWLIAAGHPSEVFEWVSQTHARASFDYEVHAANWISGTPHVFIDVKTTRGAFERPVHMSIAELRFAAVKSDYRIARLYEIAGTAPKLRILTGVQAVASQVVASLAALPPGVTVESVQLEPTLFAVELETSV